jgi:phospholipase/carboxylesterase
MIGQRSSFNRGRLDVLLKKEAVQEDNAAGMHELNLDGTKDGLLYVPRGYKKEIPSAFALMLHGAAGTPDHGICLLRDYADANNIILLAPAARLRSWDIISGDHFGPDIIFINQALTQTFDRYSIDANRIAIGGFSDGASYALCVGITNGNLFTHIIAFSPGFVYTDEIERRPKVFISHGVYDHILPIGPCSRKIVPRLNKAGFDVTYKEFEGEHIIPPEISAAAVEWFRA